MELLIAREVDRIFRWPRGRALKLAKAGRLPSIRLPDGEIRFDESEIEKLLVNIPSQRPETETEAGHATK